MTDIFRRACGLFGLREQLTNQTIVVMGQDDIIDLMTDIDLFQAFEPGVTNGFVVMTAGVSVMGMLVMFVPVRRIDMLARTSDMQMVVSMQRLPERCNDSKADHRQPSKQYYRIQFGHESNPRKLSPR